MDREHLTLVTWPRHYRPLPPGYAVYRCDGTIADGCDHGDYPYVLLSPDGSEGLFRDRYQARAWALNDVRMLGEIMPEHDRRH